MVNAILFPGFIYLSTTKYFTMTSTIKIDRIQTTAGVTTITHAPATGNITVSTTMILSNGAVFTANGVSNAFGTRTASNAAPSGGVDGDVHYQY
jgi:hypothetical protein